MVQFIPRVIVPVSVSHSQSILASLLFHGSTSLYLTLLASIKTTSLYLTLHYSTMALLFIFDSTLIFHSSTSLYMTLMPSTIALFHSLYLTLHYHGSSSLYMTIHYFRAANLMVCNRVTGRYKKMSEMEVSKHETCFFFLYNEIYVKKRQRLHK